MTDLSLVENALKWESLKSIVKVERERYFKATGKKENEISFYISTLGSAKTIANGIRKHWGIENKVHWRLDVGFSEDLSRKRTGNSAKNFTNLNRIALNILKQNNTKIGIKGKRKMAGWNNDFVFELITS